MRGVAMLVTAFVMLGTVGCGSTATRGSVLKTDNDQIGQINAAARQRGVEIIWVNPPQKRVAASTESKNTSGKGP